MGDRDRRPGARDGGQQEHERACGLLPHAVGDRDLDGRGAARSDERRSTVAVNGSGMDRGTARRASRATAPRPKFRSGLDCVDGACATDEVKRGWVTKLTLSALLAATNCVREGLFATHRLGRVEPIDY